MNSSTVTSPISSDLWIRFAYHSARASAPRRLVDGRRELAGQETLTKVEQILIISSSSLTEDCEGQNCTVLPESTSVILYILQSCRPAEFSIFRTHVSTQSILIVYSLLCPRSLALCSDFRILWPELKSRSLCLYSPLPSLISPFHFIL